MVQITSREYGWAMTYCNNLVWGSNKSYKSDIVTIMSRVFKFKTCGSRPWAKGEWGGGLFCLPCWLFFLLWFLPFLPKIRWGPGPSLRSTTGLLSHRDNSDLAGWRRGAPSSQQGNGINIITNLWSKQSNSITYSDILITRFLELSLKKFVLISREFQFWSWYWKG